MRRCLLDDTLCTNPNKITPETMSKLRDRAKADLYFFAKGILGFSWFTPEIHKPLCRVLEDYEIRRRAAVILPRGWLKTTLCSISYPIWRAIRNPNVKVLLVQNTYNNAVAKLAVIKSLFESNGLFRALFPEILPNGHSKWKTDSLCVNRTGSYAESTFEAAGTRTQVTSRHYDLIIEDDTVAPDLEDLGVEVACPSQEDIEAAIGWHRLAIPLLNNPARDQILVVGTRWAEMDLLEWVRQNEASYTFVQRAALEGPDGQADPEGIPVYPSRFPRSVLDEIKGTMGPYMYSCLYLNLPVCGAEQVFDPLWFRYYETPPQDLAVVTSVDLASDPAVLKGRKSDYNVVMTSGKSLVSGRSYVLDYWRKRANPGEVIEAIIKHVKMYRPLKVLIEGIAYQATLAYWLKERMRAEKMAFVVEVITHGKRSKEARIKGLQPVLSTGNLLIRKHHTDLVKEFLAFPVGEYDDTIDALAMHHSFWVATRSEKDYQEEMALGDPFSLDSAIKEILGNQREKKGFPYDVYAFTSGIQDNRNRRIA